MENLLLSTEGHLAVLTINRPEKLNALNRALISELSEMLGTLEANSAIRVIILTGAGTKAFVAGADISEFSHFNKAQGEALSADGHQVLFNKIEKLKKPVIAAINGFALGGGLELAMACHIRFASDNARLGLPEVSLGVIPGYGGTQRLAQLIGKGRAMELIVSAQMIGADEAYRMGLVNKLTSAENLLAEAKALALKISHNSPSAISAAIAAVNAQFPTDSAAYATEIARFGSCFDSSDFQEGTQAFLEKRKPLFSGS